MSDGLEALAAIAAQGSTAAFMDLERSLFLDGEEKEVYDYVRRYRRRYHELPTIRVIESETSVELPEPEGSINYLLDRLYDRLLYNAARTPFHELRNALSQSNAEAIHESIAGLRRAQQQASRASRGGVSTIEDLQGELLSSYDEKAMSLGLTGISSGWPYLDEESGGYHNGDFVTLVARTSIGKTWLLVYQAYQAYVQGKSTLVISTEMTKNQIANRFMSIVAGVDPSLLKKGRLGYWGQRRYREAIENFHNPERFNIYAGNIGRTTDDIDSLIDEHLPDIIFIDGFYLLRPVTASKGAGRFEKVYHVTDEIRNLSLNYDRPIVATTQFNRDAGAKGAKGGLESIAYADAIATHSTMVMSVKQKDRDSNFRELELIKGREGEHGSWVIHYGFKPPNFAQAAGDDDSIPPLYVVDMEDEDA